MYFLLSDGESPRLVKNAEVEMVMKPRHPTSASDLDRKYIGYPERKKE